MLVSVSDAVRSIGGAHDKNPERLNDCDQTSTAATTWSDASENLRRHLVFSVLLTMWDAVSISWIIVHFIIVKNVSTYATQVLAIVRISRVLDE